VSILHVRRGLLCKETNYNLLSINYWLSLLTTIGHFFLRIVLIFTARRNARIASAVLAMTLPSACPSVRPSVRPSVTLRYCVKTTARRTVQFALSDSKMCLVCRNKKYSRGTSPSPEILAQTDPLLKAASSDTFCLVAR